MRDERIWRMRALLDWYEKQGIPDDERVINAFTAIWTGGYGPEEPESTESRLEALEAAVGKLLRAQAPPETSAPQRGPSRFKKLYCGIEDFRESMLNEAELTPSERDKVLFQHIADALDKILEDTE